MAKSPELLINGYALRRESLQNLTLVDVEMCYFESTSGELIRFSYVFNMLLMTGQAGIPTWT